MAMYDVVPNYTLGRGMLFFAKFAENTTTPGPRRLLGNCPEFSLTASVNTLDHFSSMRGVREKDASVQLDNTQTAQIVCDDIQLENLALFFFGEVSDFVDAGGTVTDEVHADVVQGSYYQLGRTPQNPMGARGLSAVTVEIGAVLQTIEEDYQIDLETGMLYIVPGGGIADGTDLNVTYTRAAATQQRVLSGTKPIEGELYYREENAEGVSRDMLLPSVKLSPNGDLGMISDDWRRIPFNVEILKKTGHAAVYISDRP